MEGPEGLRTNTSMGKAEPRATRRGSGTTAPITFTASQTALVEACWAQIEAASHWHGKLPVLLHDRCWLRLSPVPVQELLLVLPPDASREAPDLVRYREQVAAGRPDWQAQQLCWEEFGPEACREAQLRLWSVQEKGGHHWTLADYLELIEAYRRSFEERRPRPVPLLVLSRGRSEASRSEGGKEPHQLRWLCPNADRDEGTMRHTCP
jgi:hypothetical protein